MNEILFAKKYPTTKDKYVGVEIEFLVLTKHVKRLEKSLLKAKLEYNVNLGSDGSVKDNSFVPQIQYRRNIWSELVPTVVNEDDRPLGKEIRVLATESEIADIVTKVCDIIKSCDGVINSTCGLHVHLDMRDRDIEKVYKSLYHSQDLLYRAIPKGRRRNKFCMKIPRTLKKAQSRYYGINRLSYDRLKTLEIRMHQGSIDADEINNWVQTLIELADKNTVTKFIKSTRTLNLDEKLKGYLNARVKKYA